MVFNFCSFNFFLQLKHARGTRATNVSVASCKESALQVSNLDRESCHGWLPVLFWFRSLNMFHFTNGSGEAKHFRVLLFCSDAKFLVYCHPFCSSQFALSLGTFFSDNSAFNSILHDFPFYSILSIFFYLSENSIFRLIFEVCF